MRPVATLLALLTLTAGCVASQPPPGGGEDGGGVGQGCALPPDLDFDTVAVAGESTRTLTLFNPGPAEEHLELWPITSTSGDAAAFGFVGAIAPGTLVLAPGQTVELPLRFSPTAPKDYVALLRLQSDGDCHSGTVVLFGTGADAVLTWSPTAINFGYLTPGLRRALEVTFSNAGQTPVTLSNVATSLEEFELPAGSQTLSIPGATLGENRLRVPGVLKLEVGFRPAGTGQRPGGLTFDTSVRQQPRGTIPLVGYGGGRDVEVSPAPVFEAGPVAYQPGANLFSRRRLSIANVGTPAAPPSAAENLHLGSPRWKVTAGQGASVDELCVGEWDSTAGACLGTIPLAAYDPAVGIAAGARLEVPLRLAPRSPGPKEWLVTFYTDDPDEPEVVVTVKATARTYPPCAYSVSSAALHFGALAPPLELTRSVTVTNLATAAGEVCLLSADLEVGSDATYSLPQGPIQGSELAPGETLTIPVRAKPSRNPAAVETALGAVRLQLNNAAAPEHTVLLRASVGQNCLVITPGAANFGATQLGCGSTARTFSVFNACDAPVTISGSQLLEPAGELPGGPNCPGPAPCPEFSVSDPAGIAPSSVIAPHAAPATFSLRYRPLAAGADTGLFVLRSTQNGRAVDQLVSLGGSGNPLGDNFETVLQRPAQTDVLLVADLSPSCDDERQTVATHFASLVKSAALTGTDYQLGVTGGMKTPECKGQLLGNTNNPKVLSSAMPNVASRFTDKVTLLSNNPCTTTENGFYAESAVAALTQPLVSTQNAGLVRPGADLAVIVLADLEDYSPTPVSQLAEQLRSVKGPDSRLTYSAIVPLSRTPPGGCGYTGFDPSADPTHSDLVSLFGGALEEVCNVDWPGTLERVSARAFAPHNTFSLTAARDPGQPLVVTVDGTPVPPNGVSGPAWTFDPLLNVVSFEPLYVPTPGSTVTFSYRSQCIP
jgi:hypothetical protein